MADYVELTPKDIAQALEGIREWIRGVEATVLLLDPNIRIKVPNTSGVLMPRRMIQGACHPGPEEVDPRLSDRRK